jgi:hypothetical protein
MSVVIDLSSEHLDPKAVVALAKAHVKSRPVEDILIKVSPRALQLYCGKKPANAVKVSKQELASLNQSLNGSFRANQFLKRAVQKCSECGRTFTFFDFFESGRKLHGEGYLTELFSGKGSHIHIQKRGKNLTIQCTACGTTNTVAARPYDGPEY